jgi:hypothetical protein
LPGTNGIKWLGLFTFIGREDGCDDVDHGGEAFVGLFVPRGDAAKRFEPTEKVFDEVCMTAI